MNSSVRPSARSALHGFVAIEENHRVVEHGRRRLQADVHLDRISRGRLHRAPASWTRGATAPSLVSRSASAASATPSHPSATRIATRRVRILPSPGRANNDSAGDTETSGVTSRVRTFGIAVGISRIPSPAATRLASSAATFISPDTIRCRIAGVCTRDSSKRNALMMCCFSTSVWLFQNNVAWV